MQNRETIIRYSDWWTKGVLPSVIYLLKKFMIAEKYETISITPECYSGAYYKLHKGRFHSFLKSHSPK